MGVAGDPDIDACLRGRSVQLEVKRPGEKPTPLQVKRLEEQLQGQQMLVNKVTESLDSKVEEHTAASEALKGRLSTVEAELTRVRVAHHRLRDERRESSMTATAQEFLVSDLFDKGNVDHLTGAHRVTASRAARSAVHWCRRCNISSSQRHLVFETRQSRTQSICTAARLSTVAR